MRSDRGASLSTFSLVVFAALIMITGLVVDGASQLAAQREASVVAAQAARAGQDAAAAQQLGGLSGAPAALAAAQQVIARHPGLSGRVALEAGVLRVSVENNTSTLFLSLIGIDTLAASGHAESVLGQP